MENPRVNGRRRISLLQHFCFFFVCVFNRTLNEEIQRFTKFTKYKLPWNLTLTPVILINIMKNLSILWKAVPEKSSLLLYPSYRMGACRPVDFSFSQRQYWIYFWTKYIFFTSVSFFPKILFSHTSSIFF